MAANINIRIVYLPLWDSGIDVHTRVSVCLIAWAERRTRCGENGTVKLRRR